MSFTIPVNPLIVYNSSVAQSLTDAQWYWQKRFGNTNYNLIGFAFGTTYQGYGETNFSYYAATGPVVWPCGAAYYGGTNVTSTYTGQSPHAALTALYAAQPTIDAVVCSTFTPVQLFADSTGQGTTLPGYIGIDLSQATLPIPNGRLGCPGASAELIPKGLSGATQATTYPVGGAAVSVSSMVYQCVTNAVVAEAANNATLNHWGTSVEQYAGHITAAYNASILSYWSGQNINTVDLGGVTGTAANVAYSGTNGFIPSSFTPGVPTQTVTTLVPAFAFCLGDNDFNSYSYGPGLEPYSLNYSVSPGAWGYVWTSYNYNWAYDMLYNGASACFSTMNEPNANGLYDPLQMAQALLSQTCAMGSVMHLVAQASPLDGAVQAVYSGHLTVLGDPLYRPYKSTRVPLNSNKLLGPTLIKAGTLALRSN
jgi:hypothetical protein